PSGEASNKLSDYADATDESVPKIAIHPIGKPRENVGEYENGPIVNFVDPHFIFEKTKEHGLRALNWIRFRCTAVDPDADRYARAHKHERDNKHRLNQKMRIKMRLISREIIFKPRPGRREDDAEKNCANREHDQWKRHHARTFMR